MAERANYFRALQEAIDELLSVYWFPSRQGFWPQLKKQLRSAGLPKDWRDALRADYEIE